MHCVGIDFSIRGNVQATPGLGVEPCSPITASMAMVLLGAREQQTTRRERENLS